MSLQELVEKYPDQQMHIIEMYKNLAHLPNPVKLIAFALRTNLPLDKAETFFMHTYGSKDNIKD